MTYQKDHALFVYYKLSHFNKLQSFYPFLPRRSFGINPKGNGYYRYKSKSI
nr:MAG TPA: hypothetical protein [Caudoviricetes sp.]